MRLDRVAFYGRGLAEYARMFDLDLERWAGARILDCPAGPASFAAEASRRGARVVACDALFGRDLPELVARGRRDISHVAGRVLRSRAEFHWWRRYRTISALKKARLRALERFARDYPSGLRAGRYVRGRLPRLPFKDRSFDLVLSGHFLFGYENLLGPRFHAASVRELLRVSSGEVRIFPIIGDGGGPYPGMGRLLAGLRSKGIQAEIRPVSFEFQKGANQMLRLVRRRASAR